jgi:NAD+ synthase (glutamine-hydrolysing)
VENGPPYPTVVNSLKIIVCQTNPRVGDIGGNALRISEMVSKHPYADAYVFPELALTGYPPEDLLLRPSMQRRVERALEQLKALSKDKWLIIGYPIVRGDKSYNCCGVLHNGEVLAEYFKRELPNYRVFDEKRYFVPGDSPVVIDVNGFRIGLTICEDLWFCDPVRQSVTEGAELIVNINASPYHYKKHLQRIQVACERARENSVPVIYTHMVGGQDELIFDGGSFAVDASGVQVYQGPWFEQSTDLIELSRNENNQVLLKSDRLTPELDPLNGMYSALVLGVRDYIEKNGFKGVVIGLSGGIDSALTLAVAVDALGAERVEAVMMPFRYTSEMSQNDAADQANRMGVSYKSIGIEPMFDTFMDALSTEFSGLPVDKTEENIQARCRGLLLMAISNKKGCLVLTTGNKSEMSVGYATLYGDMAGGFAVLKDISKMRVFALARYRNSISEVIPQNVIDRPPSAELAPDQKDEDSLPPYEVLDQILEMYIEEDMSAQAIIEAGFDADIVYKVVRLVDINEYKRRQSAVGPRVTPRGFGKDRRYPITNLWEIGD